MQEQTEEKNHRFQIRKPSWRRESVGNRDGKEGRGRAGRVLTRVKGRQISWPQRVQPAVTRG